MKNRRVELVRCWAGNDASKISEANGSSGGAHMERYVQQLTKTAEYVCSLLVEDKRLDRTIDAERERLLVRSTLTVGRDFGELIYMYMLGATYSSRCGGRWGDVQLLRQATCQAKGAVSRMLGLSVIHEGGDGGCG